MKLEEQVVSLELAKKLKKLGVKQESYFKYCGGHTMYHDNEDGEFEECDASDLLDSDEYCHSAGLTCEFLVAAFTVAELGEIILESGPAGLPHFFEENAEWRFVTTEGDISSSTEADARAKMLIYLIEHQLIQS